MNKKMITAVLLAAMMLALLGGCGTAEEPEVSAPVEVIKTEPVEVTVEPIEPTPIPEPETLTGTSLANDYMPCYATLMRGDTVKLLGEEGDCYVIEYGENFRGETMQMLVRKQFIKLGTEAVEEKTLYCVDGAGIYTSALCKDEFLIENVETNTEVTVVDELGGILYVRWMKTDENGQETEQYGFISAEDAQETRIQTVWYSSGGGGSSYGYDGGDISAGSLLNAEINGGGCGPFMRLAAIGHKTVRLSDGETAEAAEEKTELPEEGICFSDAVPVCPALLNYGDEVKVLADQSAYETKPVPVTVYSLGENGELVSEKTEDECVCILVNGCVCAVPSGILRMPEDEPFAKWEGYVQDSVMGCRAYDLSDGGTELEVNMTVTVEDSVYGVLIVKDAENVYYISPEGVSTEEYVAPVYYGWSGGGGEVVSSWTAPAL